MRSSKPELDAILGQELKTIGNGFIRVIDYMGTDEAIVQAARVSYGAGTKKVSEDRGLIRYLLRHRHTSPLEMCELKLHVKVEMDTWRQWIRHRMASVNEYSTRYSEAIDDIRATLPGEWRLQSKNNKQGSAEHLNENAGAILSLGEQDLHEHARSVYKARLDAGVAREQARKDLPLSNYTEAYWKIDAHNLMHFLALRMDSHAQLEIRSYANVIGEIFAKWLPLTWEAFNDYHPLRGAMILTRLDLEVLRDSAKATSFGWHVTKNNRERLEFEAKCLKMGVKIPWTT